MSTHHLVTGDVVELPELAPAMAAYLDVIRVAAANPDIDYRTLFSLVYSPANPLLGTDRATGGAVVRPEVLDDPAFRVMSDLLARKGLERTGRTVQDLQDLYTVPVSAAAEALGITERSIRQALTERRMAGMKKDGEWFTSPEGVEAYRVTRSGPRAAGAGQPLEVRVGGENGYGLKVREDPRASSTGIGPNLLQITFWVRLEVLTYLKGNDSARYFVLEPAEEEANLHHGPFYVAGKFKITEKINNAREARETWEAGKPGGRVGITGRPGVRKVQQ